MKKIAVYFYDVEINSNSTNSVGRLVADVIAHIEKKHTVTFFSMNKNYTDEKIRPKPIFIETGFFQKVKRKIINALPGKKRITAYNLKKKTFRNAIVAQQKKFDFILVLGLDEVGFLRKHFPTASIIYWMHNVSALHNKEFLYNINMADYFVSPSRSSYNLLLEKLRPTALTAKFNFMPNWCADVFLYKNESAITELNCKHSIGPGDTIFIFSGSDLQLKGRHIIEKAIESLGNFIDLNLVFFFAGGRMEHSIKHTPAIRIITLGIISPTELASYYHIADFGFIPSLAYDHCPLALLEMIHCNVIPIVSDMGGIKEIVGEKYPFLIQGPHEVQKWVNVILHILSMPELQRNLIMSKVKQHVMKTYNKENAFSVIDEVLNNNNVVE